MKKRKILAMLMVAALSAGMLAGCGSDDTKEESKSTEADTKENTEENKDTEETKEDVKEASHKWEIPEHGTNYGKSRENQKKRLIRASRNRMGGRQV